MTASEGRLPQPVEELKLQVLWQRLRDWLYLDSGYIAWVSRATGLCSLIILTMIAGWTWSYGSGAAVPYCVPAWRWQDRLLVLPMPPEWLFIALFTAAIISCLALMFGSRNKLLLCCVLLVFAYFGSRELCGISSNWASIDVCLLVALLFDRPGKSCTRRLVQIAVFLCYFYSAIQKISYPDFMNGQSFAAQFESGYMVRPLFVPFIKSLAVPMSAWQLASWLTIGFEVFLAFALFSKRLRKTALILGTIFHIAIVAFLIDYIITFSLVMLSGYLAFIDAKEDSTKAVADVVHPPNLETALASVFIFAMALIPLRLYCWSERPPETIVQFDRAPWTYNMFVLRADTKFVQLKFKDAEGIWREVTPTGRMKYATSDNELYSMRNFVFATHAHASEMAAVVKMRINERWNLEKTLHATAGGASSLTVRRDPSS